MKKFSLLALFVAFVCSPVIWEREAISGGSPSTAKSMEEASAGAPADTAAVTDSHYDSFAPKAVPTVREIMVSIVDDPNNPYTLVQRWDQGQPNPGGTPPEGWYDVAGWEGFQTYQIDVSWVGEDVLLQIYTDFPETGYGDGTPYGYPQGGLYQLGDIALDLNYDGIWETGIALIDHGAIPADPGGNNPPGYGLPADSFEKGGIYDVSAWFTPEDVHYYHWAYAGKFDVNAPKTPIGWMRLGTRIGTAEITYTDLGTDHPRYRVDVLLKGVYTGSTWNSFALYWGTGNCTNDLVIGIAHNDPKIPTVFGWGLATLGVFLAASALGALHRQKRRLKKL